MTFLDINKNRAVPLSKENTAVDSEVFVTNVNCRGRLMIKVTLILMLVFGPVSRVSAEEGRRADAQLQIHEAIAQLSSNNLVETRKAILALHRMGKNSIPHLIQLLDRSDSLSISIGNPAIAFDDVNVRDPYLGELAALAIDLVLARSRLVKEEDSSRTGFLFDRSENNLSLTSSGLLYKKRLFRDDGGSIKQRDLKKIKKMYILWWNSNKSKSIEDLRADWHNNHRPLINSPYYR